MLLRSQYQESIESITLLSVSTKKNGCFREAWGHRHLNRKTLCSLLIRIVCEIHLGVPMKNHWRFPLKADDNCQSFYTWHCNLLINERSFTGIHKRHPFVLNTGNISSIWKRILSVPHAVLALLNSGLNITLSVFMFYRRKYQSAELNNSSLSLPSYVYFHRRGLLLLTKIVETSHLSAINTTEC